VQVRKLSIPDAFEITPRQYRDDRGVFLEWYRLDVLTASVGHALDLGQANISVSKRGVARGIHYADVPPGQGKYVTVTRGAGIDYVVDIRVGSPTFGRWESIRLDDVDRRAVYLAEGLGHAFIALEDDTTLTYLVSDTYKPDSEHAISIVDSQIALEFPAELGEPLLSPKDRDAPSLSERVADGSLPTVKDARTRYAELTEAIR